MGKIKQQKKVNKKVEFANFESDDEEEIEQGIEEEEAQFDEHDDEKFEEIDDEEEDEEEENEIIETASNDGEEDNEEEQEDDEEDEGMEMDDEEEELSDGEGSIRYEEDIEDQKMVEARRKKLPKSRVDDQFFNLAEMEAFLDSQDKVEDEKLQRKRRNLGEYDEAEEMDEIIRAYEEENLKSRDWTLQGEVVADERRKDELLEQKVDVDFRTTSAPKITEEKTANLEAMIKKRIKEKLFDDVVRKFRENEALVPVYRNQTDIEQTVRKSLAEVYEEKFSNELEGNSQQAAKPELDPKVAAIQKDMDSLFLKLDALSHFQFRPQPIREEVKIVNNMPSLHIEEVGPTATAEPDANLMAPEELMKRRKRALKAADERTETDRKRERRQKKKKQRILASIGAMKGAKEKDGDEDKEGRKKMKRAKMGGKKLDFAGKMHELTSNGGVSSQKHRGVKRKRKTAAI